MTDTVNFVFAFIFLSYRISSLDDDSRDPFYFKLGRPCQGTKEDNTKKQKVQIF